MGTGGQKGLIKCDDDDDQDDPDDDDDDDDDDDLVDWGGDT